MYKLNLDNRILGKSIAEGDHIWGKTKVVKQSDNTPSSDSSSDLDHESEELIHQSA